LRPVNVFIGKSLSGYEKLFYGCYMKNGMEILGRHLGVKKGKNFNSETYSEPCVWNIKKTADNTRNGPSRDKVYQVRM